MQPEAAVRKELERFARIVPGPDLDIGAATLSGEGSFSSAFDVDTAILSTALAANLTCGTPTLDRGRAVALCAARAAVDGSPVPVWSDLSGYYDTADGERIQLHANFPHHAAGIVAALGCEPDRDAVARAIRHWPGDELEARLVDGGLVAARLRSLEEWNAHPHAIATSDLPLISVEQIGDAAPQDGERRLRVLDCSRVLAGPVAGSTLAAHGADVLRVGSRHLPSVEIGVLTTGSGKRNAFVELDDAAGRSTFRELLGGADVWIDAYRPGAFADRGFRPESTQPGSVTVQISAFDWVGPWAGRRGFDSIVQSTTGVVRAGSEAADVNDPMPLPVQALDYCTGLLAAFTAARLVAHQSAVGGTWLARLSLLRTRNWLIGLGGPERFEPKPLYVDAESMHTVDTPFGAVTTARPIGGAWPHGPKPLGSAEPRWIER